MKNNVSGASPKRQTKVDSRPESKKDDRNNMHPAQMLHLKRFLKWIWLLKRVGIISPILRRFAIELLRYVIGGDDIGHTFCPNERPLKKIPVNLSIVNLIPVLTTSLLEIYLAVISRTSSLLFTSSVCLQSENFSIVPAGLKCSEQPCPSPHGCRWHFNNASLPKPISGQFEGYL